MLSQNYGLLIQELVLLTLGLFGAAKQASHLSLFPLFLNFTYLCILPEGKFTALEFWVQEETPLGNLPHFFCAPSSILACHGVIFGQVLLWGQKLGCE